MSNGWNIERTGDNQLVRILCPAKLNLFLAVGPKDRRGYHPLRTIFQAIELCDVLTIEEAPRTTLTCDWAELPAENTLTKTLRLLTEVTSLPPMSIHLEKGIPAQSGLGGGSSDAAGLLRAAKQLDQAIPETLIFDIAKAVGADVSFFLLGGRARGEGYGEILTPSTGFDLDWTVVAQPDDRCSTAAAYERLDAMEYEWRDFPAGDELYNDFERVAPASCLELIETLKGFGAKDAGLTGSGSAVFGRFVAREAAEQAASAIRASGLESCWAARMLDKFPAA